MTTELERAEKALRAATAAAQKGDERAAETARQLAAYMRQMTGEAPPKPAFGRGLAQTVAQGATFGFADEIVGAGKAILGRDEGESFGDAYTRHRDAERDQLGAFAGAYPKTALAGEIGGALLVPGGIARKTATTGLRAAPTVGQMALRGGLTGAASGAAFGAGKAEEMGDVPIQAALGGAVGGGVGAALPPVVELAKRAIGAVPRTDAGRRIAQAIGRDETTPSQIQQRVDRGRALGRPVTRADVGGAALRGELEGVAQRPGRGSSLIDRVMTERNRGQLDRVTDDLMRATGVNKTAIVQEINDVMAARTVSAAPLYQRAMGFKAEANPALAAAYGDVLRTPLGRAALSKARRILNVENFDDAPLMARIDALKQGMDDYIGAARRKGENGIARRATEAKNGLLKAVDTANPEYAAARQAWAGPTAYLDAIEEGRGIMNRLQPAEQVKASFERLSASEQEAYRLGAVNALLTRMRQETAKEPNLMKFIRSPDMKDKLAAIMQPAERGRFFEIMDLEDRMFETASQALRGSQTARRIAQQREQQQSLVSSIINLIAHPLETIRGATQRAADATTGLSERQGEALARSLLAPQAGAGARLPAPMLPNVPGTRAIGAVPVVTEPLVPGGSGRR